MAAQPCKVSIGHLPQPGRHFVGRDKELVLLGEAWLDDRTNVIEFVAFGGVGKSALIAHWLKQMGQENWRGALRVLGHSFYSQGSREDAQASADPFIAEALEFFGDQDPKSGSPWEKGERLARHVRKARTLLILDGVEPLQHPPTSGDAGRIRDPGLAALVRELAAQNNGLCVITTRQAIEDITWLEDTSVTKVDLKYLTKEAGAGLLKQLGVNGTQAQLEQASTDVRGHGLALALMGNYLRKACGGDVERRGEIGSLEADEEQGGHARKVMERYEHWLSGEIGGGAEVTESGRAALDILRLMGLFDRPVTAGEFAALCCDDAIPGLTDALAGVNDRRLELAVSMLEESGLITRPSTNPITLHPSEPKTTVLDAHPLVREHFAERLAADHEEATREAHRRLYEHLKQAAPELPDNLQDMMLLYHAVAHGCKAGLHQEAHDEVLRARIHRQNEFFSTKKLGAYGAELVAFSNFFEQTWRRPLQTFPIGIQSSILGTAGFRLRALGRLREAGGAMEASLASEIAQEDWRFAGAHASNLSELYVVLGDVSAAVRAAEQSVELADRSDDAYKRIGYRTTLGDALHQSARPAGNQHDGALAAFRDAEAMQAERQREYSLLWAILGYRYCDLLLGDVQSKIHDSNRKPEHTQRLIAKCRDARNRATKSREGANHAYRDDFLSAALDHLTLGRTWLLEALLVGSAVRTESNDDESEETVDLADTTDLLGSAERHLSQSVSLLRQAGQDALPRGLLARSAQWRVWVELAAAVGPASGAEEARGIKPTVGPEEALAKAEKDLAEAESIAERGSMLKWQIDAAIERCRWHMAAASLRETSLDHAGRDGYMAARESLERAKRLIKQTEKPYEPHVPDWADWQPPEYIGVFNEGDIVGYHRRDPEIAQLETALTVI